MKNCNQLTDNFIPQEQLKIKNDIFQSLNNKYVTVLVLLDLSAPFDTIDHHTLLPRLESHFGVTDKVHKWYAFTVDCLSLY